MLTCRPLRLGGRSFWSGHGSPRVTALLGSVSPSPHAVSLLSTSSRRDKAQMPPRPSLPDAEISHSYVKGSGPGGQKINKTNSAAQLTHLPTGIVVKSQATRSRSQNHAIAKRILAAKVELLERGAESRQAVVQARDSKRKKSAEKKRRRKYRRLAGEEEQKGAEDEDEDENQADEQEEPLETPKDTTSHEKPAQHSDGPSSSPGTPKG